MSVFTEIQQLREDIGRQVLGQQKLVDCLLVALLADGHILVEGAPGLAKTRAIKVLSGHIEADFHRVQFTPDLLPADLTGTEIYRQQQENFEFQPGPLFHNLMLADEINRAPAKVQSALLEAMAERQITVGKRSYHLPPLFLVMATQNPIEQEGTYPLPEAQLDRFLMHVAISYPAPEEEEKILALAREEARSTQQWEPHGARISQETIFQARNDILDLYMADNIKQYMLQLILATRQPGTYSERLKDWIQYGASPRATIALDRCARALAWLDGRDYVGPDDIQTMAYHVLYHRLILNFEAEAEGITTHTVITEMLSHIAVP